MGMSNTKTIRASELTRGMAIKRGVYNEFTRVTRVRVDITHTTYDLEDGSHWDVRNITQVEIAA